MWTTTDPQSSHRPANPTTAVNCYNILEIWEGPRDRVKIKATGRSRAAAAWHGVPSKSQKDLGVKLDLGTLSLSSSFHSAG